MSKKSNQIRPFWLFNFMQCFSPITNRLKEFNSKNQKFDWIISYNSLVDLEFITSGSEGFVFRAQLNGRTIAVKKVKNKQETEIKHLKTMKHHNIVRFLGITTTPVHCVLMEYCSNGTLANLLNRQKFTIKSDLIWEFAFQIASGMNYLHHNQIVHRDLKSENILIADENLIKICDFGASKKIDPNDDYKEMTFVGTFPYMSPELIKKIDDFKCSEKIDIWSYGIVLWELMTCEKPYSQVDYHKTLFCVALSHVQLPITSLCPDEVRLLIEMCWNIMPQNRPSFNQILLHLQLFSKEALNKLTVKDLNQMKYKWIGEIDETHTFMNSINLDKTGFLNELENHSCLIRKQEQEVKTAKKLMKMYENRIEDAQELYYSTERVLYRLNLRKIELSKQRPNVKVKKD